MIQKTLLAEEDALILATGIRVDDKAAVPPVGTDVVEEVVDDAVAKGRGDNLADNWIMDDESDAAARNVATADDAVAELSNIFHFVELETVFVDGLALAFAGDFVGAPEFFEKKVFKVGHRVFALGLIICEKAAVICEDSFYGYLGRGGRLCRRCARRRRDIREFCRLRGDEGFVTCWRKRCRSESHEKVR